MEIEYIENKLIKGLTATTSNEMEMNPGSGKIPGLWKQFDENVQVDYHKGNRVYGVYYNYESDASGQYTVLAGTDQINRSTSLELEEVTIAKGNYLVFRAKGTHARYRNSDLAKNLELFFKESYKI